MESGGGGPASLGPGTGDSLRLSGIRVYPLKGAGGVDLREACPDSFGLPGDRRWMLVRPSGAFVSQRTHPRLALIRVLPQTDSSGGLSFRLQAPGMGPFSLTSEIGSGRWMGVQLHKDRLEGRVVEGATEWFSDFLHRPVDPAFAPGHRTSFTDAYPLLLTTEESLEDLNRRLTRPAGMLRFRPNLVVRGGKPWEEDTWRVLGIGNARLALVKPCARCSVTTVDPGTGSTGKEPLRTLSGFRGWGGKAYFGQNAVFLQPSAFRVGERVRIVEKGDVRPPLKENPRWKLSSPAGNG